MENIVHSVKFASATSAFYVVAEMMSLTVYVWQHCLSIIVAASFWTVVRD